MITIFNRLLKRIMNTSRQIKFYFVQ